MVRGGDPHRHFVVVDSDPYYGAVFDVVLLPHILQKELEKILHLPHLTKLETLPHSCKEVDYKEVDVVVNLPLRGKPFGEKEEVLEGKEGPKEAPHI